MSHTGRLRAKTYAGVAVVGLLFAGLPASGAYAVEFGGGGCSGSYSHSKSGDTAWTLGTSSCGTIKTRHHYEFEMAGTPLNAWTAWRTRAGGGSVETSVFRQLDRSEHRFTIPYAGEQYRVLY